MLLISAGKSAPVIVTTSVFSQPLIEVIRLGTESPTNRCKSFMFFILL